MSAYSKAWDKIGFKFIEVLCIEDILTGVTFIFFSDCFHPHRFEFVGTRLMQSRKFHLLMLQIIIIQLVCGEKKYIAHDIDKK